MDIKDLIKPDAERMSREELLHHFSYDTELCEQVYESLMGLLRPEYCLNWVETIVVPGQPCYEEYARMRKAYARLCQRLGVQDEDADVEIIVDALLNYGRISALEMFKYGRKSQKMLDTE